jgi:hypothetical protein
MSSCSYSIFENNSESEGEAALVEARTLQLQLHGDVCPDIRMRRANFTTQLLNF